MSKTFNRQSRVFPGSAPTTFANGDGVNTREAFDLVKMLNNLLLCEAGAGITPGSSSSSTPGRIVQTLHTASREIYICQKPIRIPAFASTFHWWIGFGVRAVLLEGEADAVATVETAYLSMSPYTGPAAPEAFDATNLAAGYTSQSSATVIHPVGEDVTEYSTAGGALKPFRPDGGDPNREVLAYLVVTMTGVYTTGDPGGAGFGIVYDEAHWFGWD
jgi:hypothetical protein